MGLGLPGIQVNRQRGQTFQNLLTQLSTFDTVEHKWAVEIGEFDNQREQFVIDDKTYQSQVASEDWARIKQERGLYRQLVKVRPIPFTEFEAHEQRDDETRQALLKEAALMSGYGFTEREICQELNLPRDYLKINRRDYRQLKLKEQ